MGRPPTINRVLSARVHSALQSAQCCIFDPPSYETGPQPDPTGKNGSRKPMKMFYREDYAQLGVVDGELPVHNTDLRSTTSVRRRWKFYSILEEIMKGGGEENWIHDGRERIDG